MYETPKERQARLYEEAMGRARRVRYEDLAKSRCSSCWRHIGDGHHALCKAAPEKAAA